MYQIDKGANRILPLQEKRFSELGFREREHLQEWLAANPEVLGEELMIIQKEFDGFDETRERLDLLALDKQGHLVIIENKLDDSGRDVVWQALKYASYCAGLTKSQIVAIYQQYLDKYEGGSSAQQRLSEFFDDAEFDELTLNPGSDQRILFVAANFRREVTSTALWLMEHRIRIQCIKAVPYALGDQLFLNLEQIIPVKEAEEYQISVNEKADAERQERRGIPNRQRVRKQFWSQLFPLLEESGIDLFANVAPSIYPVRKVDVPGEGVRIALQFTQSEVRVKLIFHRKKGLLNYQQFDRDAFLAAMPMELREEPTPGKAQRLVAGYRVAAFDEDNWPAINEWLVETLQQFVDAAGPELRKIGIEFTSG
ncbi:DUF4268 domain-containing protein [Microbulbifer elongatus]|uniref:DUF4268 domain-containing protein n=1 Tax=Microbulbifer elongatus TaxID=86173 RepID=UPI001CFD82C8|nr:DUF4268 domain-containing protein [Microbulbifer elongatus]